MALICPMILSSWQLVGLALLTNCATEMLSRMTMGSAVNEQHVDEVDVQLLKQRKQHNIILPQIWDNMVTTKAKADDYDRRRRQLR